MRNSSVPFTKHLDFTVKRGMLLHYELVKQSAWKEEKKNEGTFRGYHDFAYTVPEMVHSPWFVRSAIRPGITAVLDHIPVCTTVKPKIIYFCSLTYERLCNNMRVLKKRCRTVSKHFWRGHGAGGRCCKYLLKSFTANCLKHKDRFEARENFCKKWKSAKKLCKRFGRQSTTKITVKFPAGFRVIK